MEKSGFVLSKGLEGDGVATEEYFDRVMDSNLHLKDQNRSLQLELEALQQRNKGSALLLSSSPLQDRAFVKEPADFNVDLAEVARTAQNQLDLHSKSQIALRKFVLPSVTQPKTKLQAVKEHSYLSSERKESSRGDSRQLPPLG